MHRFSSPVHALTLKAAECLATRLSNTTLCCVEFELDPSVRTCLFDFSNSVARVKLKIKRKKVWRGLISTPAENFHVVVKICF